MERILQELSTLCGTGVELTPQEKISVSEAWNKTLAWRDMFAEAFVQRWRIVLKRKFTQEPDPLVSALTKRYKDLPQLILGMIDAAVRSLCPEREIIARESYRALNPNPENECQNLAQYCELFAQLGVRAEFWFEALYVFHWALSTHVPYFESIESEELEKGAEKSAFGRFFAIHLIVPALNAITALREEFLKPVYSELQTYWSEVGQDPLKKPAMGENFYTSLLTQHPELLEYFNNADMDALAVHLMQAMDFVFQSVSKIGNYALPWRSVMEHLGEMHRKLLIPSWAYPIIGAHIVKSIPMVDRGQFSKEQLERALVNLYRQIVVLMMQPTTLEEKIIAKAEEWFGLLANEWGWSPQTFSERMLKVKLEIGSKGIYTHTSDELQYGARVAWRNSAKCIGRISWNTLVVRDRRHVSEPAEIFQECLDHLKLATGGTNLLSVMTVFAPQQPHQHWGTRFWNSQFVRFAGYAGLGPDGSVLGDPANAEFTSFLISKKLWTPPELRTQFDVLPLVLKVEGEDNPYVFQLPEEYVHLCYLSHPKYPKVAELGLRWCAVPAITNFNLSLGGVDYICCPFNGWFMELEIVRNLMERYHVAPSFAQAIGLDTSEKLWENRVFHELSITVLHSFEQHRMTIVDQYTASSSFYTHCQREKAAGRECPGQWSWIGGLIGPNHKLWHHEMRDFLLEPQYHYCADQWLTLDLHEEPGQEVLAAASVEQPESQAVTTHINSRRPRVLILFGSETGNAEAVARKLSRSLRLLKPTIEPLNKFGEGSDQRALLASKFSHLIVVTSTFGTGNPPMNANQFLASALPSLKGLEFSVLAMGSSIYPDFAKFGVQVDKALEEAQAHRFIPLFKADDAKGSATTVAQWSELVLVTLLPQPLRDELIAAERERLGKPAEPPSFRTVWLHSTTQEDPLDFHWEADQFNCTRVTCESNIELLEGGDVASRSTRKLEFRLPEGLSYETGDHLTVIPLNPPHIAKRFARLLSCEDKLNQFFQVEMIDNGEVFPAELPFSVPARLGAVLRGYVDFALRTNNCLEFLRIIKPKLDLVPEASDLARQFGEWLSQLASASQGAEAKEQILSSILDQYPTVVHLLEELPAQARPDLAEVLPLLSRLAPRYYSISSSGRSYPLVNITVGVVHATTPANKNIYGICSNYLARLNPGEQVLVSVKTSSFRAPASVTDPVMYVGPGTGLAPMMGFLQDRHHEYERDQAQEFGPSHVFFGCRTNQDIIYGPLLQQWHATGKVISDLHVALSRQTPGERFYVQDKMQAMGERLKDLLLNPRTHYYVCGDAKMADGCFEACVSVLRKYGPMSRVAAIRHLTVMKSEGRWQLDVWGIISHFAESRDSIRHHKRHAAKVWLQQFASNSEE